MPVISVYEIALFDLPSQVFAIIEIDQASGNTIAYEYPFP